MLRWLQYRSPVCIWQADWRPVALGPSPTGLATAPSCSRVQRSFAGIPGACCLSPIEQYFIAPFYTGTSICFISTVGYVSIQRPLMKRIPSGSWHALTSIVLLAPVIRAGVGAADGVHSLETALCHHRCFGLVAWFLLLSKCRKQLYLRKRIQTG